MKTQVQFVLRDSPRSFLQMQMWNEGEGWTQLYSSLVIYALNGRVIAFSGDAVAILLMYRQS